MRYCWRCAEYNGWRMTDVRRVDQCEVCGQRADCSIALRSVDWKPVDGDTDVLVDVPFVPAPRELMPWEQTERDAAEMMAMIAVITVIMVVVVPAILVMASG